MYSLRRVLAARFSLTMLVALSLIALWAFLGAERMLRDAMDGSVLSGAVHLSAATLEASGALPQIDATDFDAYVREVNRFIVLRDGSGRVLDANAPVSRELPAGAEYLARARRGEKAWATESWSHGRVRSLYAPAPAASPPGAAVIQVAASLTPLEDENRRMLFLMIGTVLLGTMATVFGSSWLAGSAVAPVLEVAAQANGIVPASGGRITVHGDVAEYEALITVINKLLGRADQAFDTQRRFIGDVSHELRTPIAALQGQIEVTLRNERSPRDYQLVLQGALEETQHLSGMCETLLLITQAEGRSLELHRAPADLNAITLQLLERLRRRILQREISVQLRLGHREPWPSADAGYVAQVLEQLMDNAVKLSRQGGSVAIGTETVRGGVRWWIEDSGPGIDEADMPRLFEPFYRVDPARSRDSGSGLGLTLASSITRLHGGTIRAHNITGDGARFEVELPV